MAKMDINKYDDFALGFNELVEIPDAVLEEMLQAEGKIIKEGQQRTAISMLQGPYNKGAVAGGVTVGKMKKTKNGKALYVSFTGTQHGERIATIAFINEFGKRSQPPRQFVRVANEQNAERAIEAAASVYDNHLAKKGF